MKGLISLTCDAWQAGNTDGYFAVTAHWIEENLTDHHWELRSALIGFTQLNNAHTGERLGQALFKIVDRLGIADKVCVSILVFSCPVLQFLPYMTDRARHLR